MLRGINTNRIILMPLETKWISAIKFVIKHVEWRTPSSYPTNKQSRWTTHCDPYTWYLDVRTGLDFLQKNHETFLKRTGEKITFQKKRVHAYVEFETCISSVRFRSRRCDSVGTVINYYKWSSRKMGKI